MPQVSPLPPPPPSLVELLRQSLEGFLPPTTSFTSLLDRIEQRP